MNREIKRTAPSPASSGIDLSYNWRAVLITVDDKELCDIPLNTPPSRGPAMAEQLHVILKACDQIARRRTSTISEVMIQTALTIPPAPIPASII